MAKFSFTCGCKFDKLDFDKIPLDCPATWDLISSGLTKGIFQLEGQLGKRYAKELKPRNIEELSDLVSLIRPGCLEAEYREDPENPGKMWSITTTYQKVKDKVVEPEYIHEVLKPIFEPTYSVPVYQEQIMRICTDFAGFTLQEADKTRKAVGKKKKDVMEKVKIKFIDGAKKMGHDKELAETVFGWIDKFSGYGFNKSHGVSYAMIGYQTAYAKRHFPLHYFKSMLTHSEDKQDSLEEIQLMVYEAKRFGIAVNPPCLKLCNEDFAIQDDNNIAFGLGHIKGIGSSSIRAIKKVAKCDKIDGLLKKSFTKGSKVKKNVMEALIKSGAMDYLGENRHNILVKYKILSELTEREQKAVFDEFLPKSSGLFGAFDLLCQSKVPNKTRKQKIIDMVHERKKNLGGDSKRRSIAFEKFYLGIPLSGNEIELYNNPRAGIKCNHFHRLPNGTDCTMGVIIEKVKEKKDKRGRWMCFLVVSDDTYLLDGIVVFASVYDKVSWIIEEGKPVLLTGKKDNESFLVRKIEHL